MKNLNPRPISTDGPHDLSAGDRVVLLGSGSLAAVLNFPSAAEHNGEVIEIFMIVQSSDSVTLNQVTDEFFVGNTFPPTASPITLGYPSTIFPSYRFVATSLGENGAAWEVRSATPTNIQPEHYGSAPYPLSLGFSDEDALVLVGPEMEAGSTSPGYARIDRLVPFFVSAGVDPTDPLLQPWMIGYVHLTANINGTLPAANSLPQSTAVYLVVTQQDGAFTLEVTPIGGDTLLGVPVADTPSVGDVYVFRTNGVDAWWTETRPAGAGSVDTDQVVNVSSVPGATATEALDALAADIAAVLKPYIETYDTAGTHNTTIPEGYRLAGAWMAPGAGGGAGGGSGGTGHTAGASGGGGSGGVGGQGGGGTQLQHIPLDFLGGVGGTAVDVVVGAGGVGGAGGVATAPGGATNSGSNGGRGGNSRIDVSGVGTVATAQATSPTTQSKGMGIGGNGGNNGTALAGGAAASFSATPNGFAWPWFLSLPSDNPPFGGLNGQVPFDPSGAGGDPGVNGANALTGFSVGTNAMITGSSATAIQGPAGASGGAQQGGVHGGGGAGSVGGSGGLGWEWNSPAGSPSSPAGQGGAAAAGGAGSAGTSANGATGNNGIAGTHGRGGGGGSGGGASGHGATGIGNGGAGGNGAAGSPGCVILEFVPA